ALPMVPRLTGHDDVRAQISRLNPDLVLDYGDLSPRFVEIDRRAERTLGIPVVLLDGALARTPATLRELGVITGRTVRAGALATLAEAVLAAVPAPARQVRVVYARGPDGLLLLRPGSTAADIFRLLGWSVQPPPGDQSGSFGRATMRELAALEPDVVILADPAARAALAGSPEWTQSRAALTARVLVAPGEPFGWIEEPPSINRLLGLSWLSGNDPGSVGALLGALLYGRLPPATQIASWREQARRFNPHLEVAP
ncbi:MAG: ABC transporter substrate-binding protein, partial [Gaiellaceae bacterium]